MSPSVAEISTGSNTSDAANHQTNGNTNGDARKNNAAPGSVKTHHNPTESMSDNDQAVRDIRKLVVDCCRQNVSGHGGSAIGMAPLAVALWAHTMRYSPSDPDWYDRDRFVFSNGHAGILLYVMMYLTGHESMTMQDLKLYVDPQKFDHKTKSAITTNAHCHPEREVPGIEITTGPLGQGIANAVGLAIASKQQAALFNKEGSPIISSRIYCATGDACLQEGVALEAISIAGHFALDNLILVYDNNAVTNDGPLDWIVSEDINAKMVATGWYVIDVFDGDESVDSIISALALAKTYKGKPTFINIRTTIGYKTSSAGTAKSHHDSYSEDDAALYQYAKDTPTHTVSEQTQEFFRKVHDRGDARAAEWKKQLEQYNSSHSAEGKRLAARMSGKLEFEELLKSLQVPANLKATRSSNGFVFETLIKNIENMFGGSLDVWGPNKMGQPGDMLFDKTHHHGRVARFGIREHAAASISNGIAAYAPNAFVPVTATFFMFYLYAAAGVRMGALNKLHVIHVATHDSIQEGQNGPTHQPVELDSLYRAMPDLLYIRPADAEEVVGAWMVAMRADEQSSIISVARAPPVGEVSGTSRDMVQYGGYVVYENEGADVTICSTGSELGIAISAAKQLSSTGTKTRVVSMPCFDLFDTQPEEYKDKVLTACKHVISLEPYVSTIWARYCNASIAMDGYGFSADAEPNYARFGLDVESVVDKVHRHVAAAQSRKRVRAVNWTLLK